MSRLGNIPVSLPAGVEVAAGGGKVTVKGPKGTLARDLGGGISVEVDAQARLARVRRSSDERQEKALHGLYRSLLAGMVQGVTKGFHKDLDIVGVGYRAAVEGGELALHVGFSQPRRLAIPEGLTVACPAPTQVHVEGIDKQKVGEFAARVRKTRPPDPYQGKGIRYRDEAVRKLAGKTFGSTATT